MQKFKLTLPDDIIPPPLLVHLMGAQLGLLCRRLELNIDVAVKANTEGVADLMVHDPDHTLERRQADIRVALLAIEQPMLSRLIWFSLYSTYDGP